MKKETCERCGDSAWLRTVETTQGKKQQVRLCRDCVAIVIRPGTNYQVKR